MLTGVVGSNPVGDMDVCLCYSVPVLSCVQGEVWPRDDPLPRSPTVYRIKKVKKGSRPNKRTAESLILPGLINSTPRYEYARGSGDTAPQFLTTA
jgi:hypothetical protein